MSWLFEPGTLHYKLIVASLMLLSSVFQKLSTQKTHSRPRIRSSHPRTMDKCSKSRREEKSGRKQSSKETNSTSRSRSVKLDITKPARLDSTPGPSRSTVKTVQKTEHDQGSETSRPDDRKKQQAWFHDKLMGAGIPRACPNGAVWKRIPGGKYLESYTVSKSMS
jgi:hypothetical protein